MPNKEPWRDPECLSYKQAKQPDGTRVVACARMLPEGDDVIEHTNNKKHAHTERLERKRRKGMGPFRYGEVLPTNMSVRDGEGPPMLAIVPMGGARPFERVIDPAEVLDEARNPRNFL